MEVSKDTLKLSLTNILKEAGKEEVKIEKN